jgi:4-hydroxy-tetrahydrodipicolinate reductase
MGSAVIRLSAANASYRLVGAMTERGDRFIGKDAGSAAGTAPLGVSITETLDAACDALIDFTNPAASLGWAEWCAARKVAFVSGTTGLSTVQQSRLRELAGEIPLLWARNMSIGVNVLLGVVGRLAQTLGESWDIEICEAHHRHKIDAPSGTALALLENICAATGRDTAKSAVHGRQGDCGPRKPGEIGLHALRLGDTIGEHEIHFATVGESITLRHRAFTRDAFAGGALRAARWLIGKPPGMYEMLDILGLR